MRSADKEDHYTAVCLCCADFLGGDNRVIFKGVICRGNSHCRTIFSNNGLGPEAQITIPSTISQCLLGATDIEPHFLDLASNGSNPDTTQTDQDDEDHLAHAKKLHEALDKYALIVDDLNRKDTSVLEPRGIASEAVVAAILDNLVFFPWISDVQLQPRHSEMDMRGIDIVISLTNPIAGWLTKYHLDIQVKSDPRKFVPFLCKQKQKADLDHLSAHEYLLQRQLILLNGGAGEVSLQGVIGPFICQLFQLIYHHSGSDTANLFLSFIHSSSPEVYQYTVRAVSQDIIASDYREIVEVFPPI